MLLLLVQDDEARVTGGKHRAAGADDDFRVAAFHPLPLVVALGGGQAAVEHRYLFAEIGRHQPQKLGGQSNFRHHQQSGLSSL